MLSAYNRRMGKDMTMGLIDMLVSIMGTQGEQCLLDEASDSSIDTATMTTPHAAPVPFTLDLLPIHITRVSTFTILS